MEFLKKLFESKENKLLRNIISVSEMKIKKGFYTLELDYINPTRPNGCSVKFEMLNGEQNLNLVFTERKQHLAMLSEEYAFVTFNRVDGNINSSFKGVGVRLNKTLVKDLMDKFEMLLTDYQANQEERYMQFIKELSSGNFSFKERVIGAEGIEEGKELVLSTDQGINLIFTRESKSLLIKVKDSEELYLRSLEYSMDKETFVNAKVRKLNISSEEKEELISFVKEYLDSKDVTMLFTEEELLLSKINA